MERERGGTHWSRLSPRILEIIHSTPFGLGPFALKKSKIAGKAFGRRGSDAQASRAATIPRRKARRKFSSVCRDFQNGFPPTHPTYPLPNVGLKVNRPREFPGERRKDKGM